MSAMPEFHDDRLDRDAINLHIARRLRRRRRLMGLTQIELGDAIRVTFQQIQKYECASVRLSAARLYMLAGALRVPIQHFFEGFSACVPDAEHALDNDHTLDPREARDVLDAYARLSPEARRRFLALMKSPYETGGATPDQGN